MCYRCDDPVPGTIDGDPSTVQRFANQFSTTSSALRDAARELRNLANENITISLAVDEVRENAGAIADDTDRVAERYEGAASTFSSYASALEAARSAGNGARTHIVSNNASGRYWRHRERDLRQQVQWGSTDAEVLEDLQEATRRANHYDAQYATYLGQYQAAIEDREQAVTAAINGLANAEAASGLNDGFWDGIAGDFQMLWELASKYLGPILEGLRDVLEVLKQILDVITLIVALLSIICPALGPLALGLAAVSALLAVAIFACSLLLFAMGRETIGRVLSDGLSAAASVLLAVAGGGGLFGSIKGMFSGFSAGAGAATSTVTARLGDFATDQLVGGLVSANLAPIQFALEQEADFQIGSTTPWGGGPDRAEGLADMFTSMADLPTLGFASVISGGIDGGTALAEGGIAAFEFLSDLDYSQAGTGGGFDVFGAIGAGASK